MTREEKIKLVLASTLVGAYCIIVFLVMLSGWLENSKYISERAEITPSTSHGSNTP